MNVELVNRIRTASLPSLPATMGRVLALAENEYADLHEIAQAAAREPALWRRLLRAAEYGRSEPRDLVKVLQACLFKTGLRAVRTLTIASALVDGYRAGDDQPELWTAQWQRSLYAAAAARELALHLQVVRPEDAFLAGLAMDLGVLVLGRVVGEPYYALLHQCTTHPQLLALEEQVLGLTHPQVSALIAPMWRISGDVAAAMPHQHSRSPGEASDLAQVLEIAGRCADLFVDQDPTSAHTDARHLCRKLYGMDGRALARVLEEVAHRASEAAALLDLPSLPYQAALERANGALAATRFLVQQRIALLEQKQPQPIDPLTGLASRGRLDEMLHQECQAAALEKRAMSVLLIEIDRFEQVSQTHGRPTGEQILRAIGATLARARRQQDIAARYDETALALVLPGTSRLRAAFIAEAIRKEIAAGSTPLSSGQKLKVTASIGVATMDALPPARGARDLLATATLARDAARQAGGNCISVQALIPAQQETVLSPTTAPAIRQCA